MQGEPPRHAASLLWTPTRSANGMCVPNEAWHLETPWPWARDAHGSCHTLRHACRWPSTACEACPQELLAYQLAGPQGHLNHTRELGCTCCPQRSEGQGRKFTGEAGRPAVSALTYTHGLTATTDTLERTSSSRIQRCTLHGRLLWAQHGAQCLGEMQMITVSA